MKLAIGNVTSHLGPKDGPNCDIIIQKVTHWTTTYKLYESNLNPPGGLRWTPYRVFIV